MLADRRHDAEAAATHRTSPVLTPRIGKPFPSTSGIWLPSDYRTTARSQQFFHAYKFSPGDGEPQDPAPLRDPHRLRGCSAGPGSRGPGARTDQGRGGGQCAGRRGRGPMRKFMTLHRNVRVRIGLAFVHKLIDAMILTFIAIYLASR